MVKNQLADAGDIRDAGLIPGSGRSPGEGKATHSRIPTDRGATVHRVPESQKPLKMLGTYAKMFQWRPAFILKDATTWKQGKGKRRKGKKKKKSCVFILKHLQSLMGLVKDIINYPNSRKDTANATNPASYQIP